VTHADQGREYLGSTFCEQYNCEAEFYLEPPHSGEPRPATGTGVRHLIVVYGEGCTGRADRPLTEDGRRQFAIGVPDSWTKQQLLDFLLQTQRGASFPKWEAPTRAYGLNMLK
jgi:hypothetical protein